MEQYAEGTMAANVDKLAIGHIKNLIVKALVPVLKSLRSTPDLLEEYKQEYGYLGVFLHSGVSKARTQPNSLAVTCSSVINSTNAITSIANTVSRPISSAASTMLQQVRYNSVIHYISCSSQDLNLQSFQTDFLKICFLLCFIILFTTLLSL